MSANLIYSGCTLTDQSANITVNIHDYTYFNATTYYSESKDSNNLCYL